MKEWALNTVVRSKSRTYVVGYHKLEGRRVKLWRKCLNKVNVPFNGSIEMPWPRDYSEWERKTLDMAVRDLHDHWREVRRRGAFV